MSAIRSITIEGFRSFAALRDLPLRPLNVLIGANGSGKSNFLEALKLMELCVSRGQRLDAYVQRAGGANRLLHFGSKVTRQVKFEARFGDDKGNFSILMHPDAEDRLFPLITATGTDLLGEIESKPNKKWLLGILQDRLANLETFHFHDTSPTSPIKKQARLHDNRYLRRDGSNLAPFLYRLRKKHEDAYDAIRRTVRLVAPFFEDFALEPLAVKEDEIRLEWRHVGSDAYFDASSFSDGSLRFIALATVLLQPLSLRPSLILLDEPELGLHPYAITLLASLLKQASVDSQIIVATQSSVLLDHFEPEDVLVADRVGGATTLRRLEGEKFSGWLEDYSLGQLWEKNQFGGRPSPRAG
ncbi:AAA family ATPase [Candidatus Palauibacter sp.]|uniref:AAA family ATPase n=1 Tax=Candidatus Palauibacter sp. TaxID=3101350 RepID=UPI003B018992